jgi:hypothetical protein
MVVIGAWMRLSMRVQALIETRTEAHSHGYAIRTDADQQCRFSVFPRWGAVTEQARQAGCSRQAIYKQEARVVGAVEDAQSGRLPYRALQEETGRLGEENRQLWLALETAVDFPLPKQQQFTATASAMGLSLTQILVLLAIVLPPPRCPQRTKLGRVAK